MKLIVELYLEIMCICLTANNETAHECVMDFVALGVISELDERYYDSLKDPLKDKLEADDFKLPIINTSKNDAYSKS